MHLLVSLLVLFQADPAAEAVRLIDEAALKAHVEYLADDKLEGRAVGFPGNEKAAEYIVKHLKEAGARPAGDGASYYQLFVLRDKRPAKNIIALLEGSDARLKGEFVAVGGHFDHVGTKSQRNRGQVGGPKDGDEIYNGADDNASGTATILLLAKAFAAGPARPKRSILFCLWNAEETGLEGSTWWTQKPTRPIERVVYCLTLDMIGRNSHRPVDIEGVRNSEGDALEKIITAACEAEGLRITPYDHHNEAMFRADGAPFLRAGVPASMIFSYWHDDYHRVTDHADKVEYPNLAKVARASFRILKGVADLEARLRFNPNTPLRGKSLGIEGEEIEGESLSALKLGEGKGAYRLKAVEEGKLLGMAGFRAGDVVLGFGGKTLPAGRAFMEFWVRANAVRPKQEVEVEVLRGGKRQTFTARWPE